MTIQPTKPNSALTNLVVAGLALGVIAIGAAQQGGTSAPATPQAFTTAAAKNYCESQIKDQLRDPSSYEFIKATVTKTTGTYNENGTALVSFRARNGFGGMNQGIAVCEGIWKEGSTWTKASLLN